MEQQCSQPHLELPEETGTSHKPVCVFDYPYIFTGQIHIGRSSYRRPDKFLLWLRPTEAAFFFFFFFYAFTGTMPLPLVSFPIIIPASL